MDYLKIYEEEHLKNGLSYGEIRNKYNIPRGTWDYYIRKKYGKSADLRKYRCNDDFFDNIDSEIKAYLLGFLYADGYIASDGRIGILLNSKDVEIEELMRKFIAPNSIIKEINYQNFKRDKQVRLRFKSKRLYARLKELGFTTDKTHTNYEILSKIPEPFKKDFIRGYTDGDGSVRFDKVKTGNWYKVAVVYCNGVPKILEEIKEYFSNCNGILRHYDNYYTLNYEKKKDAEFISRHLYLNSSYYLKRKFKKAMNIIKYCNNTELNLETKESKSV